MEVGAGSARYLPRTAEREEERERCLINDLNEFTHSINATSSMGSPLPLSSPLSLRVWSSACGNNGLVEVVGVGERRLSCPLMCGKPFDNDEVVLEIPHSCNDNAVGGGTEAVKQTIKRSCVISEKR